MKAQEFILEKLDIPEAELENKMIIYLSKWFFVKSQITSIDNKSRIDLMLTHKSNNTFHFGIEIKRGNTKKGGDIGRWVKQSIRYSKSIFKGYEKKIIFVFPQLSFFYLQEGKLVKKHDVFASGDIGAQNNASTFLGALDLGELQFYDRSNKIYSRLTYRGHIFWDSKTNKLREDKIVQYI